MKPRSRAGQGERKRYGSEGLLGMPVAAYEKVRDSDTRAAGFDQQDDVLRIGEVGAQQLFVCFAERKVRQRVAAVVAQHGQAGPRAGAEPIERLCHGLAVGVRKTVGRPEAMLTRDRLEILHHQAVSIARAKKNTARLGASARNGGEGFADFLVNAFHHATPHGDRRRPRSGPFDVIRFHSRLGVGWGPGNGK